MQDERVVFYVEDEPVNVMLMRMLFDRRPRLRLEVARSGQEALALALAGQFQPELLLLDLRLPDCFGDDLLVLLRRQPGWEHVPAVAVTAEAHFDIAGSSFAELWRKPMDLLHVLARLDAFVDAANPAQGPHCPVQRPLSSWALQP